MLISHNNIVNVKNDKKEGELIMKKNESIGCEVTECKNHSGEGNYCALNKIQVVKHSGSATTVEQTDCGSFAKE